MDGFISVKTWIVALLAILLLWVVGVFHVYAFEMDVRLFGIFKDERTYPILVNAFFVFLLGVMILRFPVSLKTKAISLVFFCLTFMGVLLAIGLEGAVLGIFGSPDWKIVQDWASLKYPEKTWVQEPWRVPQSGCGAYCQDVHTWIKIRTIIVE